MPISRARSTGPKSTGHRNTDLSRKFEACREGSVQGGRCRDGRAGRPQSGGGRPHRRQKNPTGAENVGEQPRNTDLSRKNAQKVDPRYRPLAQVIPTPGAKNSDPRSKGMPTSDTGGYRPPTQECGKIPTPRASNTDLSRKVAMKNSCKPMDFSRGLRFPCCLCVCSVCCRKNWED
jgi:hypothetical protein